VSAIELCRVSKVYSAGVPALDAIDLAIEAGERVVVLGPSGSGKTTLLRLIAGLETADTGSVAIGGRNMDRVPPHHRDVAMVFQNPALYPHLNVFDNIAFGLAAWGVPRGRRRQRVSAIAELLGLDRLLSRRPADLSGGERQRVAIGRAVVRNPSVLLLDEPFSSLDLPLRTALRDDVIDIHRKFGSTLVHVTHDQSEALSMGQRIAVLDQGRLMQVGPPREIYDRPAHRFVAGLVGTPSMNILPCEVFRDELFLHIRLLVPGSKQVWTVPSSLIAFTGFLSLPHQRLKIDVGLRPENVIVHDGLDDVICPAGCSLTTAVIRRLEFQGSSVSATLAVGEQPMSSRIPASRVFREGQQVVAVLDFPNACWFDPKTGLRWEPMVSPNH
jgi:multiple sugar transport system ATP-binding protein